MVYPNGFLFLPDIYRAVFERIGARTIGATKIFPGDFHGSRPLSMIPKSVQRFSEKIMLKQEARAGSRFKEKSSRSSPDFFFFDRARSQLPSGVALRP